MTNYESPGWLSDGRADSDLLRLHISLHAAGLSGVLDISNFWGNNADVFVRHPYSIISNALERARQTHGVKEVIRVAWLESMSLNAIAVNLPATVVAAPPSYFIGVTHGSVFVISNYFLRLWSSPEYHPEIGESREEIRQSAMEVSNDGEGVIFQEDPVSPKCRVRKDLAHCMSTVALTILAFHEATHLFHGHMDENAVFRREISAGKWEVSRVLDHTLEMDADSGAVILAFNELMKSIFSETASVLPDVEGADTLIEIRRLWGVGPHAAATFLAAVLAGFFILFKGGGLTRETMYLGSHPHPTIRHSLAFLVLKAHMEQCGFLVNQTILKSAFDEVIAVARQMSDKEQILTGILHFWSGSGGEYIKTLSKCWNNELYDELNRRKLTNRKLAPPN